MTDDKGDNDDKAAGASGKLISSVLVTGGTFVLRKLLATAWTKVTGRVPPTDPADAEVTLPQTLAWAVASGIVLETARFGLVRALARRAREETAE